MTARPRSLFRLALVCLPLALALSAGTAHAQKLGKRYFEDEHNGYRFRHPVDWTAVPIVDRLKSIGVLAQFDGDILNCKLEANMAREYALNLYVFQFKNKAVLTPGADGGSLKRRVKTETRRRDISEIIPRFMGSLRDYDPESPVVEEEREVNGVPARHRTWTAFNGYMEVYIDTWTFSLPDFDVVMVYDLPTQHERR